MVDITDKYRKLVGKNKFNIFEGSREEMEKLGKKWMKDDEFHEVISFPIDEIYGDVVVWEEVFSGAWSEAFVGRAPRLGVKCCIWVWVRYCNGRCGDVNLEE